MDNSILNRTSNKFRCVGTVNELALKREACKVKVKDDKEERMVDGERIRGKFSVKTEKGVHTFDVFNQIRGDAEEYLNSLKDGEAKKKFKKQINYFHMFEEMMNWIPAIGDGAGPEPTKVNVKGSIAINDYVNQQGEISSGLRWNVSGANTQVSPDDSTGTTLNATLYIDSIVPEVRNEEETGRLKVTLYGADSHGACFPVNAIVPISTKDEEGKTIKLASVFEDCFEPKMTVPFTFELTAHHVGGKGGKKKFGKNSAVAVNDGFDVTELLLVGADDEIEEPDELTREDENGNEVEVKTDWINPETMIMAKRERAKKLEEMKKNPPAKKGESTTSNLAAAKAQAKSGKFGAKPSVKADDDFESFDELDLPF